MDTLKRGDLITVAGGSGYAGKPRPALVVQSDLFNETHASITVVPVTTTLVDAPLFRVPLPPGRDTGLRTKSHAMVDKITSVPRERVGKRIGGVSGSDLEKIEASIRLWLDVQ